MRKEKIFLGMSLLIIFSICFGGSISFAAEAKYCEGIMQKGIDLTDYALKIPSVTLSEEGIFKHINPEQGTIEFWVKPHFSLPTGKNERYTLFFWGHSSNLNSINLSMFWVIFKTIIISGSYKPHVLDVRFDKPLEELKKWQAEKWHHIAFTWNCNDANERSKMELFIDGKSVGKGPQKDKSFIKFRKGDFPIYIGAARSTDSSPEKINLSPANAVIDELRISDTIRYSENFIPSKKEFVPDKDTKALFHFNGEKNGIYLSPAGEGKINTVIYGEKEG